MPEQHSSTAQKKQRKKSRWTQEVRITGHAGAEQEKRTKKKN
jgi:hypothetical protein